jgi:hypothetical protein
MNTRTTAAGLAAAIALIASPALAATLTPLGTFGGDDGWRAPYEVLTGDAAESVVADPVTSDPRYRYLGNALVGTSTAQVNAGNLERGLAYNHTTGRLLLASRNGGTAGLPSTPSVRVLDAATGVDLGALDFGSGVVTGGTFAFNMLGVGDDGAIYLANLTTNSTTSPYKIYRWADETAAPTVAFDGTTPPLAGARIGDTFDVIGSGANTRLVAGYGNNPAVEGNNSFALFTTGDGANFIGNHVTLSATPPNVVPPAGEFRLGLTFQDSDTVIGKSSLNPAQVVDLTSTTAGDVANTFSTDGISLRPMDFAVIDGRPIIAMIEATNDTITARARVFVYDMSDLSAPLAERQLAVNTTLPEVEPGNPTQFANGNGTGQVKFGAITGNSAVIYAMSTNNGIEAFTFTLDPVVTDDDADFDQDGDVDGADFLTWQQNVGAVGSGTLATGDANGDFNVDGADLDIWETQFGMPAPVGAIPEPATAALALVAAVGLLARSRNRGQ